MTEAKRGRGAAIAALILIPLMLFSGVRRNEFTLDSRRFLANDSRVEQGDVAALFTTDYWNWAADPGHRAGRPGLYRPLSLSWLSLWLHLGGVEDANRGSSAAVNLSCLFLHILGGVLRFLLFLALLGSRPRATLWAFLGALATVVHPIASEIFATQVGASEGLAGVFSAAILLLLVTRESAVSKGLVFVLTLLALLSKENAASIAVVSPLLLWMVKRERPLRALLRCWPVYAGGLAWFALRSAVLGIQLGVDDPFFAGFPLGSRIGTALSACWSYDLPAVVFPSALLPVVTFEDVPPVAGVFAPKALLGAALFLGAPILGLWLRARAAVLGWGLLAAWFFFLPVANVLMSIGALAATRFLFLPLLGLGAGLSFALSVLWGDPRSWARPLSGALVVWFIVVMAGFGMREAGIWKNNATLFEASFERAPTNSWAAFSAGNTRRERGADGPALEAWRAALDSPLPKVPGSGHVPENILDVRFQAAMNGGTLEWTAGRSQNAEGWYAEALELAKLGADQAKRQPSTTTWSVFCAQALDRLAGVKIERAIRSPGLGPQLQIEARKLLERAEGWDPGNLEVALSRVRLPLCRRDQAAYFRELEALYLKSRARIPQTSHALRIAQSWAEALSRKGRKSSAIEVKLSGALAGKRWVADARSFLNLGMQGARSGRKKVRKLAREALEEYLRRESSDLPALAKARETLRTLR